MKIVNQSKPKTIPFGHVEVGDVFGLNGAYYMKTKTEDVEIDDGYNIDVVPINAVNVSNGKFARFCVDSQVMPFDCELIIK
jgi:hypothetical protein